LLMDVMEKGRNVMIWKYYFMKTIQRRKRFRKTQ
jgi:hypothetical protein